MAMGGSRGGIPLRRGYVARSECGTPQPPIEIIFLYTYIDVRIHDSFKNDADDDVRTIDERSCLRLIEGKVLCITVADQLS